MVGVEKLVREWCDGGGTRASVTESPPTLMTTSRLTMHLQQFIFKKPTGQFFETEIGKGRRENCLINLIHDLECQWPRAKIAIWFAVTCRLFPAGCANRQS